MVVTVAREAGNANGRRWQELGLAAYGARDGQNKQGRGKTCGGSQWSCRDVSRLVVVLEAAKPGRKWRR